jgi:flagellin-like protein
MQTLRNLGHGKKKGVTPVIATILLIAGTIVLALVVGAYTFGLFGSNVKTIQLNSANLFSGPTPNHTTSSAYCTTSDSYLTASLNNPGAATGITSITITGAAVPSGVTVNAYAMISNSCTLVSSTSQVPLAGGAVTPVTLYFGGSTNTTTTGALPSLASGQTFNYVVNFANGQSISGSLIAS